MNSAAPAEQPGPWRSGPASPADLVINRKTAQVLGLTSPPSIPLQADEVIH